MDKIKSFQLTNEEPIRLYYPGGDLRIVAIGGGHGQSTLLRGLKRYSNNITAIVTVADDGGSSGMLRQDLGILPPGDARACVLALANSEPMMEELMNYRFKDGSLAGQNLGNLLIAALNGICGSFAEAVRQMGQILAVNGRVLPVTEEDIRLRAHFDDGSVICGESTIFYYKKDTDKQITKIELQPEHPAAYSESLEAIEQADLIVIGPGSLYTSIIPNFLVDGITEAVLQSKAYRLLVLNLMTQDGETEGYTAADHIRALLKHSGSGVIHGCLGSNTPMPAVLEEEYRKEGQEVSKIDREEIEAMGISVFEAPMLARSDTYARHDPDRLAASVMRVYQHVRNGRRDGGRR